MVINLISVLKSEAWQQEMIDKVKGRIRNFKQESVVLVKKNEIQVKSEKNSLNKAKNNEVPCRLDF
jgi:hypothetical protein